jgi:hypothetical protein
MLHCFIGKNIICAAGAADPQPNDLSVLVFVIPEITVCKKNINLCNRDAERKSPMGRLGIGGVRAKPRFSAGLENRGQRIRARGSDIPT